MTVFDLTLDECCAVIEAYALGCLKSSFGRYDEQLFNLVYQSLGKDKEERNRVFDEFIKRRQPMAEDEVIDLHKAAMDKVVRWCDGQPSPLIAALRYLSTDLNRDEWFAVLMVSWYQYKKADAESEDDPKRGERIRRYSLGLGDLAFQRLQEIDNCDGEEVYASVDRWSKELAEADPKRFDKILEEAEAKMDRRARNADD